MRWRREFGRKFKIKPDQSLNYLEYRVIDKNQNVLDLIEEKDTSSSTTGKKDSRSRNRSMEHSEEKLTVIIVCGCSALTILIGQKVNQGSNPLGSSPDYSLNHYACHLLL